MLNRILNSVAFRLKMYLQHTPRLKRIRNTPASVLTKGEIDALELLEIIRDSGKEIHHIYDIGANIGSWALLAKAIFPKAEIQCFEPLGMPDATERTMSVFSAPGVTLHPYALGNEAGTVNINVASRVDSSSLLTLGKNQKEIFGDTTVAQKRINIVRLDEYIREGKLPLPDMIKLDIQGYELEALKGGIECMQHARFILLEVSFIEFYEGQPLFSEIVGFMQERGFAPVAFGTNTALGIRLQQTDVLFERKEE